MRDEPSQEFRKDFRPEVGQNARPEQYKYLNLIFQNGIYVADLL